MCEFSDINKYYGPLTVITMTTFPIHAGNSHFMSTHLFSYLNVFYSEQKKNLFPSFTFHL